MVRITGVTRILIVVVAPQLNTWTYISRTYYQLECITETEGGLLGYNPPGCQNFPPRGIEIQPRHQQQNRLSLLR